MKKATKTRKTRDLRKPRFKQTYYILFAVFAVIFALSLFLTQGQTIKCILFADSSDSFMDHFNSVVYNELDPYESLVIYPPLACVLYKYCNIIIPQDDYYSVVVDPAELSQPRNIRVSQSFLFQFILFSVFSITVFLGALSAMKKGSHWEKVIFTMTVIFSAPFLFMVDRANNILLTLTLTMFFLAFYTSENKVLKELALISLSLATGIKIYPLVFCLLIFIRRDYKALFREILYSFITLILPFFLFYNGFESIRLLLRNILHFDTTRGSGTNLSSQLDFSRTMYFILGGIRRFTGISFEESKLNLYCTIYRFTATAICGFCALFSKKEWKSILFCSAICIGFPGSCASYMPIFLIPAVVKFLDEEKTPSLKNYGYLIFLLLTQVPLAMLNDGTFNHYWPAKVSSLALSAMVFLGFLDLFFGFAAWNEARRRDGDPFFPSVGKAIKDYFAYLFPKKNKTEAAK